jgi:hypothetical protein
VKVIVALAVLALIVLVVWAVAGVVRRSLARRRAFRAKRAPWELNEYPDDGDVVLLLEKPGCVAEEVARVPLDHPDFGLEIEKARNDGDERLIAMNRRQK